MRILMRMPIMRSKAQAWHALSLIREEMRTAAAFVFALCGTETWHALALALALVGEEEPPLPFSSLLGQRETELFDFVTSSQHGFTTLLLRS
jgi:hypothetical protein